MWSRDLELQMNCSFDRAALKSKESAESKEAAHFDQALAHASQTPCTTHAHIYWPIGVSVEHTSTMYAQSTLYY